MKQKMRIDPHVHCRGKGRNKDYSHKETIAHTLELARQQCVTHIIDMPNLPMVKTREDVRVRLMQVPQKDKGRYFLYIGLTANVKQITEAILCYSHFKEVVGFKLYAGRSTGDLAIIKTNDQAMIFATLASLGYEGPVAVHCEKEAFINETLFDPFKPYTHSLARPEIAEIASIQDIIAIAKKTNFKGALHICHVSCVESVELIDVARKTIKITCEVTPHHISWDNEMPRMRSLEGLGFKMNPPLRSRESMLGLREQLKAGKIDWIATDHAPHAFGEKFQPPYPSGYPSLYIYKNFVEETLPELGLSKSLIRKMTCDNIIKTLKLEL